ncbi:MAG: 50S ribosomal protein L10 [archaeon]|nr:50S ribosomal protein L10 [archaeon]
MKEKTNEKRQKEIPQEKLDIVSEIANKIRKSGTVLIASTKKLPSSQFHEIKKNLRGKADIVIAKKSLILRAIDNVKKASVDGLKEYIVADSALFFSDMDPFELSGLLADNQSPTKAKTGDIVPEDVVVEPGPTDLIPGPAISELSGVGLKVAVEGGKLAIKQGATIVKAGEKVKENVAGVMSKLGITPLKVGFEPVVAYDSRVDKIYVGIKIDKKKTLEDIRDLIRKALGFAIGRNYATKETITYFIAKAGAEEKAIQSLVNKKSAVPAGATQ